MKKLKTIDTGGFPLVLDDIRWMNNGIYESLKALAAPYYDENDGYLILSGLTSDIGNNIISPGYVFMNDEIFYCEGYEGSDQLSAEHSFYFNIKTEYDASPSGLKVFRTNPANPIQVYEVRTLEILDVETPPLGARLISTDLYRDFATANLKLKTIQSVVNSIKSPVVLKSQLFSEGELYPGLYKVYGQLDISGTFLKMWGKYVFEDIEIDNIIFTLPSPFTTNHSRTIMACTSDVSSSLGVILIFEMNGGFIDVRFKGVVGGSLPFAGIISFDGIEIQVN